MAKTTISCPQCKQPVAADITRVFDTNQDPAAKQTLLSGAYNLIQCPNCGFRGQAPTPIVYHDPDNELLLTFFPPELNVPVNRQEQMIGPMIKDITDNLPPEKRKAYLFNPQTMLTRQRLMERILEEDGITPEMLKDQQERLRLLQRLAGISPESRPDAIKQEEALIDEQLFMILQQLIQSAAASGDEQSANVLSGLQQQILKNSTYGQKLLKQAQDQQTAVKALEKASKEGLTRQKLLDLLIDAADNDIQLITLVSMARGGLDYGFFQLLSERVQLASGEEQKSLIELREKLLEMTHQIDEAVEAEKVRAGELLDAILESENIEEATLQALQGMNEIFFDVLRDRLRKARKDEDQAALAKLEQITQTIQKISSQGANFELIEALIKAEDKTAMQAILEENADDITDEFMQYLTELLGQTQKEGQEATAQKLQEVYGAVLRFTMKRNLSKKEEPDE
jgi:hypothetical protein